MTRKKYKDTRTPAQARERWLKSKYNLTPDQYNELFVGQNGVCVICKQPERIVNRQLAVDHNHTTGKIRGLLCAVCNTSLGIYESLGPAFSIYLKEHDT